MQNVYASDAAAGSIAPAPHTSTWPSMATSDNANVLRKASRQPVAYRASQSEFSLDSPMYGSPSPHRPGQHPGHGVQAHEVGHGAHTSSLDGPGGGLPGRTTFSYVATMFCVVELEHEDHGSGY